MFGERLKALRQSRSLSQEYLARNVGVTKQSVCNWENDNIMPSVEMTTKLARFFRVSTDYLLGLDDTAPSQAQYIEVSDLSRDELKHIQFIVDDIRNRKKED
ncbi:MAG: helix-turn-helix transcriptional regulator [Clostridiales bacterium]|nr:helix-turn-helix transcriptional regulator [Clostridiales bacterium]